VQLDGNYRIFTVLKGAFNVLVSIRIVFPLGSVDKISKLVFPVRHKLKRDGKAFGFDFFHGIGRVIPVIEMNVTLHTPLVFKYFFLIPVVF